MDDEEAARISMKNFGIITPKLRIIPVGSNKFLGKIDISESFMKFNSKKTEIKTIVILDVSGSMGDWVPLVVKDILPKVFQKLNYKNNEKITLLAFDSDCELFNLKIKDLKNSELECRGGTYLCPTLKILERTLDKLL